MGFNQTNVKKIKDHILTSIPLGPMIVALAQPPPFRPDDHMFHLQCNDPDRMVNDLGLVPSMGDYSRHNQMMKRVRDRGHIDILALGGSITAGGYFLEFARSLREKLNLTTTVHNHGHGATEITYTIFCVDIENYEPDIVLIDFSVNDMGPPKLMEALIRKTLAIKSRPVVLLVNLWVYSKCATTRYLQQAYYYGIPLINMCPAVNLCFGRNRGLPKYISDEYSLTDGIHPWGSKGVTFIGSILYAWFRRYDEVVSDEVHERTSRGIVAAGTTYRLPAPLYVDKPIGVCTRCEAMTGDADAKLKPLSPPKGFRIVTRVKVGYGGFNPNDTRSGTKSFKKSWQAEKAGSTISFKFYGSSVKVAMWQRRDGMGVLEAVVDGNAQLSTTASGFFKGYTWDMARNNTGRSEIMPLFEGLEDKEHTIEFTVSEQAANRYVRGHTSQIFALLSASDNKNCKGVLLK
eukprot:CAMPEP_0119042780 /NCGR_PEP_ID=MMETSP1177-20130426/16151_1 /TAXON_ID=2985 /ORGANISM="Ochromonas sp, Strain CCMP1899" /LENGTH=459 /DNA_ID=CAMNT_0007009789 /DNA_START=278 /DNA_END=1657 /DNA_ORIENTATION=+